MVRPALLVRDLLTQRMAGDIYSLHVFGKVIVVLSSLKANKDLLEKRSGVYSDRPVLPIFQM